MKSIQLVWAIGTDFKADIDVGFITSKVFCLIESLLGYRMYKHIRCIVFIERVITAVVLEVLLGELLPKYISWKTKYVAGNKSGLRSQTRKKQNEIVAAFREGLGKQNILLELGSQFKLSGAPLETLHQICAEVNSHLHQVLGKEMADIDQSACRCENCRQLHFEDVLRWLH